MLKPPQSPSVVGLLISWQPQLEYCFTPWLEFSSSSENNSGPSLDLRNGPRASGHCLLATLAVPDSNRVSLDAVLAAKGADIASVLGDFHLLDLFSEGCTITSAVFTGHADLCELSASALGSDMGPWRRDLLFVRFVILARVDEELDGEVRWDVVGEDGRGDGSDCQKSEKVRSQKGLVAWLRLSRDGQLASGQLSHLRVFQVPTPPSDTQHRRCFKRQPTGRLPCDRGIGVGIV